jgi:hypothetical protein
VQRSLLVLAVLALAGCTGARQQAAEDALSARVGEGVQVSCTRSARVGYVRELRTKIFICLAKRGAADCDRYKVTLHGRTFAVRIDQRHADCILPPT